MTEKPCIDCGSPVSAEAEVCTNCNSPAPHGLPCYVCCASVKHNEAVWCGADEDSARSYHQGCIDEIMRGATKDEALGECAACHLPILQTHPAEEDHYTATAMNAWHPNLRMMDLYHAKCLEARGLKARKRSFFRASQDPLKTEPPSVAMDQARIRRDRRVILL